MESISKGVDWIWYDGAFVRFSDAHAHILSYSFHYGLGVWEGIRAYRQPSGQTALYRLTDHMQRLLQGCKLCMMACPYSLQGLETAAKQVLAKNQLGDCYLRPFVFLGGESMGIGSANMSVHTALIPYKQQVDKRAQTAEAGVSAMVSSYLRGGGQHALQKGKIVGQYTLAAIARREAKTLGMNEVIFLDNAGCVTEASTSNIFVLSRGVLKTPPTSAPILEGFTRDTVIRLAQNKGMSVAECSIARDELYLADEVFLTGTAAEITPVIRIDGRIVGTGTRGPITTQLQSAYKQIVLGGDTHFSHWLTDVET